MRRKKARKENEESKFHAGMRYQNEKTNHKKYLPQPPIPNPQSPVPFNGAELAIHMEDELKSWYRQSLNSRISGLESAKKLLSENFDEAVSSIRRIARSLRNSSEAYGFPEISAGANLLEKADAKEEILRQMDALILLLRANMTQSSGGPTCILLIGDDPEICNILKKKLSGPSRIVYAARTSAEAMNIIREKNVSIILTDLILPDMDGRNLLIALRENSKSVGAPILLLSSSRVGEDVKSECFALGADEYYEKPFNFESLCASVSAKIVRAGELSMESRRDHLTGLPNRSAFVETFSRAAALAKRRKEPLALAMIDFDSFKMVNDTTAI